MKDNPEIEREILWKLARRRVWRSKHIRLDTLLNSGWKPHEKGLVKDSVKSLLKKGYLLGQKEKRKQFN